jgi:hypothetical protein
MSDEQRREPNWRETESMEDAARRLWRDWDERKAKKAAECLDNSAQIEGSRTPVPACREKSGRDSERKHGSTALKLPGRQLTPPQGGGIGGDPVAEVGRSNGMGNTGGQADFGISSSLKYKDTTRPALDEALADRPRRYPDAPEDGL